MAKRLSLKKLNNVYADATQIGCLKTHINAILPTRVTENTGGLTLYTCLPYSVNNINANPAIAIRTGVAIQIPRGHFCMIVETELARNTFGLFAVNSIRQSDFRGEFIIDMKVNNTFSLSAGFAIAQVYMLPYYDCEPSFVSNIDGYKWDRVG